MEGLYGEQIQMKTKRSRATEFSLVMNLWHEGCFAARLPLLYGSRSHRYRIQCCSSWKT